MSLILLNKIERITEFDDTNGINSHIVCELKLLNYKNLEEKAKQIDKENYSKDCFGIEFSYVYNENKFYVLDFGIFYIDNNGRKNFLECEKKHIISVQRQMEIEFTKFLKNKEKYSKDNNVDWDII